MGPRGFVSAVRFLLPSALGLAFFALPVSVQGRVTVPFDLAVQWLLRKMPTEVAVYCLALTVVGAVATVVVRWRPTIPKLLEGFRTSTPLILLRLAGVALAILYFFRIGPQVLFQDGVADLIWNKLALSVAVIVPLGATLLVLLVRYGLLEFIGTLMRPVMRPLFRLPGRSALDSLTSWVGSYSVGLYLTRKLMEEGYYNRREAYTIVTCFSTVSIGFVALVAQTLAILHLFPLIFLTYFLAVYLMTAILARTWPITGKSEEYLAPPRPEPTARADGGGLLRTAWEAAIRQANQAPRLRGMLREGFTDGLVLASTILGSILAVGTAALLLAKETPIFTILGQPLVPVLDALGLPDSEILAPATLVGVAEMYIPALLTREAALPARFFIAVLSISQLIFFSAVAPMMIDMFRAVPVRARELLALFLMRTAVLIPVLAAITALLGWAGLLTE